MRKFWKRKAVAVVALPQGEPSGVADVFYRWCWSAQDDPCPSCGAVWVEHSPRHEDGWAKQTLRHEAACVYNEWEEFGEIPCAMCGEDVVDNWDNRHLHSGKVECDRP